MENRGPKKIVVARSAGFCWGVRRAFDKVMEVAKDNNDNRKIYTYGPLIHNPHAVKMLEREGIEVIDTIPDKLNGAVFIRTHGISPDERRRLKEAGVEICDVTCPDVGAIQAIVRKHLRKGYNIVIVGNSEHPEVKALLGYAEGKGVFVSSVKDVGNVPSDWGRVCVVAQSTQKEEDFTEIANILKGIHKDCKVFNTICKSTAIRQEEVRELAKVVDAMVVVGGYNSANTYKLAQISGETGTPTFHIESAEELTIADISKFNVLGITAGASTPRWSIEEVVRRLKEFGASEVEDRASIEEKVRESRLST